MEDEAGQLEDIVSENGDRVSIAEDDCGVEADDEPVDNLIEEVQRAEVRHLVGNGRYAQYLVPRPLLLAMRMVWCSFVTRPHPLRGKKGLVT